MYDEMPQCKPTIFLGSKNNPLLHFLPNSWKCKNQTYPFSFKQNSLKTQPNLHKFKK